MQKAKIYERKRLVMFDSGRDNGNLAFGLNEDLISLEGVNVLTKASIKSL